MWLTGEVHFKMRQEENKIWKLSARQQQLLHQMKRSLVQEATWLSWGAGCHCEQQHQTEADGFYSSLRPKWKDVCPRRLHNISQCYFCRNSVEYREVSSCSKALPIQQDTLVKGHVWRHLVAPALVDGLSTSRLQDDQHAQSVVLKRLHEINEQQDISTEDEEA